VPILMLIFPNNNSKGEKGGNPTVIFPHLKGFSEGEKKGKERRIKLPPSSAIRIPEPIFLKRRMNLEGGGKRKIRGG